MEWYLPIDGASNAVSKSSTGWGGPLRIAASASAAAAGRPSGLSSTAGVGTYRFASQWSGDGYAVDFQTKGDATDIQGGYVQVKLMNFGDVYAYAAGDNSNVQAKARVGQDLTLRGTTKCGPYHEMTMTLVSK